MVDFIILQFSFFLILSSIIGYGFLFRKLIQFNDGFVENQDHYHLGLLGIYGIFLLIFISYASSLFFKHNIIHNSIVFTFGLFVFLKNLKIFEKKSKIFILPILYTCIFILVFKNHDDFHYYHFPYTFFLVENTHPVGLGNFNLAFRTPSSIFFLNSLFYLPFIKEFSFNFGQALMFLFCNFYFLEKIFLLKKKNNKDVLSIYLILCLGFINIFFYRLAEYGTDRSAQIFILILIFEILHFINFESFNNYFLARKKIINIIILIIIIISLKAFYVLYFLFLIPIVFLIIKKKKINFFKFIIFSKINIFFIIYLGLVFLIYFLNTSCFLYPLKATCIETSWYLGDVEVDRLKLWYEQWSKAGAGPNFRVDNPEQYIQKLNWLPNWLDMYFFNKVSDFLIGLMILLLITYFTLILKKNDNVNSFKSLSVITILSLLFLEWFFHHPSLRYGGYVIIASIFFIIYINFFKIIGKKNRILLLIVLFFSIGMTRNIYRISKEMKQYNYNLLSNTFYLTDKYSYRVSNRIKLIDQNYYECSFNKKLCIDDIILEKKFSTKLYKKK